MNTIVITDKFERKINNINRCFIVVNGKEYKIQRRIYDAIQVGVEYEENEHCKNNYRFNPNSKYLMPLYLDK